MSIATYTELKAAIAAWQNKTNLTSYLGDFIRLAEAKINRRLRVSSMEAAFPETAITAGAIARPAGMVSIKSLWTTGTYQRTLEQKTLEYIMRKPATAEPAQFFAWGGTDLVFSGTGNVAGVYFSAVPALSDAAPTNWLLTASPDLYLWSCLEQANIFLKNVEEVLGFKSLSDSLIEEMNNVDRAAQFSGGPLVARAR